MATGVYTCSCCGKQATDITECAQTRHVDQMMEHNLCYVCCFWYILVHEENVRVCRDYIVYRDFSMLGIPSENEACSIKYMVDSDHSIVRTNNMWPIGRIPEKLRDFFKPNIQILYSEMEYRVKQEH